jgi:hypothetical protein
LPGWASTRASRRRCARARPAGPQARAEHAAAPSSVRRLRVARPGTHRIGRRDRLARAQLRFSACVVAETVREIRAICRGGQVRARATARRSSPSVPPPAWAPPVSSSQSDDSPGSPACDRGPPRLRWRCARSPSRVRDFGHSLL